MRQIYVVDISLAAILASIGIPIRQSDPVTRELRMRDGKEVESAKFWFDVSDDDINDKAHEAMGAYSKARDWQEFSKDKEDPIYWMKGVLENRTALLHMFHHGATPMKVIEDGDRTIYIGPRLSQKNREILKKAL